MKSIAGMYRIALDAVDIVDRLAAARRNRRTRRMLESLSGDVLREVGFYRDGGGVVRRIPPDFRG